MCNPYEFFGLPNIWPRGYPLDQIKAPECNEFARQAVRPLILQVRPVTGVPSLSCATLGGGCAWGGRLHANGISLHHDSASCKGRREYS